MLHNYLVTGLRALARNRVFAAINIVGLAIGMAACILLLLFVRYETSYDDWLPDHDDVYQVQTFYTGRDNGRDIGRDSAMQMSAYAVGRKSPASPMPAWASRSSSRTVSPAPPRC